jgi:hypothetical protein
MRLWIPLLLILIPVCAGFAQGGAARSVAPPFAIAGDTYHVLDWRKDTLSNVTALSQRDRATLTQAIMGELGTDKEDLEIDSERELRSVASESRAEVVDLNGGGHLTVVVQASGDKGGCSPTGNCPFWIFEKETGGWRLLFDRAHPREAQTFMLRSTRTNGYRDLILSMHGSAYSSDLTIYHFRGGIYRAVACYEANWHSANPDDDRPLKSPRVEPCVH